MPVTSSINKKFPIPGSTIYDTRLSDMQAIKSALVSIDASLVSSITANFPGTIAAAVGTSRNYPNKDIKIKSVSTWVSENATTDVIINIRKNGAVTQAVTIPTGQLKVTVTPVTPITLTPIDYLTVDIVSGSGKDLVVRMDY